MQIHQTSVQYVPAEDRLLLRVSTREAQLFDVWLTRRLVLRAHPLLKSMVARMALAQATAGGATVLPEAQTMLAEAQQARALKGADFSTPFNEAPRQQPLGAEPMLAVELQMTPLKAQSMRLSFLDDKRRHLTLDLNEQLSVALLSLLERALSRAEWGAPPDAAPPDAAQPEAEPERPRTLN